MHPRTITVGRHKVSFDTARRDYRCRQCGIGPVVRWSEELDGPHVVCAFCGGTDFIHEYELERQKSDAIEVLDELPRHLKEQLETEERAMPVKDRRGRRLARLGIIRLGYTETKKKKRADGSEYEVAYPKQADHFVLTDAPELAEIYGPQPRELDVILPFPDVDRNFDSAYTVWAGGVLVCRGDGEFVEYATPFHVEEKKGRVSVYNAPGNTLVSGRVAQASFSWNGEGFRPGDHVPCPGAAQDMYPHCAACKLSCILKVMMSHPDLFRFGYYQIATGSDRNYRTIMGTLEVIAEQARRVSGIPFKLRMVEEQTTFQDDDGMRKKTKKWFLQLEPEPGFTRALYRKQMQALLQGPEGRPALPEPEDAEFEAEDAAPPPFAEAGGPAEEPMPEEPEFEEPRPVHWIDHRDARVRFWKWARDDMALNDADVYAALGVQHIHDYTGTMVQAKSAIEEWVIEQAG